MSCINFSVDYDDTKDNHKPTINAQNKNTCINKEIDLKKIASASDFEDGDLSANIIIDSSHLDITKSGNYPVIYSVTDSNGATAQKTIIISVMEHHYKNGKCTACGHEATPSFDNSSNKVDGIYESTTIVTLQVQISYTFVLKDHNGKTITDSSAIVKTGNVIEVNEPSGKREYEVVIKGDSSGDGKIDVLDMECQQKAVLGIQQLSGAYKSAAALTGSDKITVLDIEVVQKYVLGLASSCKINI
jgi:hypothetical protein